MARGRNSVDASNEYLGNTNPIAVGEIGRGDVDDIEVVQKLDAADLEAFMNEPVTVVVSGGSDEYSRDFVELRVNGILQLVKVDEPQTIKRKYIEKLARAKNTAFDQNLNVMDESMNSMRRRHSLKYPFQVVQDSNPKGPGWLKQILSEPV